jgi:hypothetical protein
MQQDHNEFIEKLGKFSELDMREYGLEALRQCIEKYFEGGCSVIVDRVHWINRLIQLVSPGTSLQVQRDTDEDRFYLDGQQVTNPPFDQRYLPGQFIRCNQRLAKGLSMRRGWQPRIRRGLGVGIRCQSTKKT